jgi:PAS domain S-box-containing protein
MWVGSYLGDRSRKKKLHDGPDFGLLHIAADGQSRWEAIQGQQHFPYRYNLLVDQQDNLWLAMPRGLTRLTDGASESLIPAALLQPDEISSIFQDREDSIWIGYLSSGISQVKKGCFSAYGAEVGMPGGSIVPITGDGQGGLWIGAACGGLFHFREGRGSLFSPAGGPSTDCVWSLLRDRSGALWVGTWGNGVYLLQGSRSRRITRDDGLAGNIVLALCQDRSGAVWIGCREGLSVYRDGRLTTYRQAEGLVNDTVHVISEDARGRLWIGTENGISQWENGRFHNLTIADGLSNGSIRDIYEDSEGTVWIGTYGGGLNRLKNGRFFHFNTGNGLYDNVVSRVIEDDAGNLWMTCNRGVFHASRCEMDDFTSGQAAYYTCYSYGREEGMRSSECNGGGQPTGCKGEDGRLWFPTIKGLVAVNPRQKGGLAPKVIVERVNADDRSLSANGELTLGPGVKRLVFYYVGLSFRSAEKVGFRCRLEGFDRDWVQVGNSRTMTYTNLAPGAYTFRVIACSNDGVWNRTGALVRLHIRPYFYQTTFFLLTCGLVLVLLGAAVYGVRVHGLRRRECQLSQLVEQRTGELHQALDQLERAKRDLEEANATLESRVQERTEEFVQANLHLQAENAERRQAEAALRSSENRYRTLFDGVPVGLYRITPSGRFLDANRALVGFLGYENREEVLSHSLEDFQVRAEEWHQFHLLMERDGQARNFEMQYRRRDGSIIWVRTNCQAVQYQDERTNFYEGSIEDITELRKLEQHLMHTQKMESIGTLASGISHDFNNILTVISASGSMLEVKLPAGDPLQPYLRHILDSTERASYLTRSLLAFSRKQTIDPQPIHLHPLIDEVGGFLKRLLSDDIVLTVRADDEDLVIVADRTQIELVLVNLATNARDAMPAGGELTVASTRVEIVPAMAQAHKVNAGLYAQIAVSDTGQGMDEHVKAQIFDPFFTTKELGKGTGLGLSIVYGIVHQHNGFIDVYSEPGKGTTFKIYLPVSTQVPQRVAPAHMEADFRGRGETVLLVEDDPDVRETCSLILKEFGYQVLVAENGEKALASFQAQRRDIRLVILDVMMPRMHGQQVYTALKQVDAQVKAIFISGYPSHILAQRGLLLDGQVFVSKPIVASVLLRQMRQLLDS